MPARAACTTMRPFGRWAGGRDKRGWWPEAMCVWEQAACHQGDCVAALLKVHCPCHYIRYRWGQVRPTPRPHLVVVHSDHEKE